jgi:hypothetical protein
LPFSVDPDYYSPLEVTYPFHRAFDKMYNDQIDRFFLDHAMGLFLAPGSSRSGYVFTNLDLGTKSFNADLIGDDNMVKTFTFFISVPGLRPITRMLILIICILPLKSSAMMRRILGML